MRESRTSVIVAIVLTACGFARAIPPPWSIEEWKSKADLILIARTMKIEPVKDVRGVNSSIGIEPVEILKGKVDEAEEKAGALNLRVLFFKPLPARGHGGVRGVGAQGHCSSGRCL